MIQEEQLFTFAFESNVISPKIKPILRLGEYFPEDKIENHCLMLNEEDFSLPSPIEKDQIKKVKKRKVTERAVFSDLLSGDSPLPKQKYFNNSDTIDAFDYESSTFEQGWNDYTNKISKDTFVLENDLSASTRRSSYCTMRTSFPYGDRNSNMCSTRESLPYITSPSMSKEFDWNEEDEKNLLSWKQNSNEFSGFQINEIPELNEAAYEISRQSQFAYEESKTHPSINEENRKESLLGSKRLGNPINKIIKVIKENNVDPHVYRDELLGLVKTDEHEPQEQYVQKKLVFKSKKESYTAAMKKASKKNCCSCKQSHCLKLYCECFKVGDYCHDCTCPNCLNRTKFEALRQQSITHLKNKNKNAFKPVVCKDKDEDKEKHIKGCKCKNSNCKKNYCECYQNGIGCSSGCKCTNCLNGKESNQ